MKKIQTLLCSFLIFIMNAQVTNEGKPHSWSISNKINQKAIVMEKFNLKKIQEEDKLQDKKGDAPWRFGFDFVVNLGLENAGLWTTLPSGDRIWTIRIQSKGAKTINFLLNSFYIPKDGHLYLYNNDRTDLLGAYNEEQNNENQVLGTWLVSGEDVWLEYFEPKKSIGKGKLNISKVIHGYRTTSDYEKTANINTSADCNHDVNCPIGILDDKKEINKKSVAMMITGGSGFCTGSLVNNTANDGKRYFLTANHCYDNPASWAFRFNWISTNNVCASTQNSTSNTNYYETVSGATLRARRFNSDFCLVEINSSFPTNWDIIWAGWDRTSTVATSTFGIHHPSADIMKVCKDDQPPTSLDTNNEQVWRINDWDLGVTEGGSSGSPLYNENGRLIGQLWRGTSFCNGTNDNNGWDEYGRFHVSWDAGGTESTQLKNWLDPNNTGALTTDVYPVQQIFQYNAAIQISNIDQQLACNANTITPVLKLTNQGSLNLTSATITYNLNGGTPYIINWTGNLPTNSFENISLPAIPISLQNNTFSANVNNPNGQQDQNINNNSGVISFSKMPNHTVNQIILSLQLDLYGSETTWNLKNSTNTIIAQGGPYQNSGSLTLPPIINETINLNTQDCYTFTINDSESDGICCVFGAGFYEIKKPDNTLIFNGGSFSNSESKSFSNQTLTNEGFQFFDHISIAPNPSNGIFNLVKKEGNYNYNLYNILGQELKKGQLINQQEILDLTGFENGIYILKLNNPSINTEKTYKLIKN
jgi:lysyl endopeptidase